MQQAVKFSHYARKFIAGTGEKKIERKPAMISGSWKQKSILTSHTSYPKNRHFAQEICEWTRAFPNGLLDHEVMIQRIVPSPVLQMN